MVKVANDWAAFLPKLLFAAAVAIWILWVIVRRRGGASEPSCGACGYLAVGLTTSICPECGKDLADIGIRMPGDVRPMPRMLRAVLFTLVYCALAAIIWPAIEPMLPRWYAGTTSLEMSYPRSESFHSAIAVASGSGWTESVKFDHVDLTLVRTSRETRTLAIDIRPDGSKRLSPFSDEDEQSIALPDVRELTPDLVFGWMATFLKSDSPALRDEAASISAETIKLVSADMQIQHTAPHHTPFASLNFRQLARIPMLPWRAIAPVALIGIILWGVGIVVIYRRSGRHSEVAHA